MAIPIYFPEPCMCGADDCPRCYPGRYSESDDQEEDFQELEED